MLRIRGTDVRLEGGHDHYEPHIVLHPRAAEEQLPGMGKFGAEVVISAPGRWGRTQMGSDGFSRILTGLYFFSPVRVRLVPQKTHDSKGF